MRGVSSSQSQPLWLLRPCMHTRQPGLLFLEGAFCPWQENRQLNSEGVSVPMAGRVCTAGHSHPAPLKPSVEILILGSVLVTENFRAIRFHS